jgi:hypothetical protein
MTGSIFSGKEKEKNHLNKTFFIKKYLLTSFSSILMIAIVVNELISLSSSKFSGLLLP